MRILVVEDERQVAGHSDPIEVRARRLRVTIAAAAPDACEKLSASERRGFRAQRLHARVWFVLD